MPRGLMRKYIKRLQIIKAASRFPFGLRSFNYKGANRGGESITGVSARMKSSLWYGPGHQILGVTKTVYDETINKPDSLESLIRKRFCGPEDTIDCDDFPELLKGLINIRRLTSYKPQRSTSKGNLNKRLTESEFYKKIDRVEECEISNDEICEALNPVNEYFKQLPQKRMSEADVEALLDLLLFKPEVQTVDASYCSEPYAEEIVLETVCEPVRHIIKKVSNHRVYFDNTKKSFPLFIFGGSRTISVKVKPDILLSYRHPMYGFQIPIEVKKPNLFFQLSEHDKIESINQVLGQSTSLEIDTGILADGPTGLKVMHFQKIKEEDGISTLFMKSKKFTVASKSGEFTDKVGLLYAFYRAMKEPKKEMMERISQIKAQLRLTDEQIEEKLTREFYLPHIAEDNDYQVILLQEASLKKWRASLKLNQPYQEITLTLKDFQHWSGMKLGQSIIPPTTRVSFRLFDKVWAGDSDMECDEAVQCAIAYSDRIKLSQGSGLNSDLISFGKVRLVTERNTTVGYGFYQILITSPEDEDFEVQSSLPLEDKAAIFQQLTLFHSFVGPYGGDLSIEKFTNLCGKWFLLSFRQYGVHSPRAYDVNRKQKELQQLKESLDVVPEE